MVYHLEEEEFKKALLEEKDRWLIDVRSRPEFEESHLEGAMNIDVLSSSAMDDLMALKQDKPIFVYCQVGVRSRSACKMLTAIGFERIYHLRKGIQDWTGTLVN